MPKEQRIEEVERGSTPIQVDHVRSSAERKTEEVSSREKKSQDITNEGRVDNFEGPGEMQRRRRSLSKAGRSRDTSRAKETITSAINAKENKERKTSGTRSSSRGREMVVERKEERRERGRSRARDLQVPMTLRQPFLDDPFFKGTLKSLERSQSGEVMVSRQFSRRFGMPQNVKKEDIVSNLSQYGVMVISMPKEQRIEEVERGSTPIQVDHVRSSAERKTEE